MVTLVDRCSRYLLTGISHSRKAEEVAGVIRDLLLTVPSEYRRTLTMDSGSEFAEHRRIAEAIPSLQGYFAHPMSPWERGSNEILTVCPDSMCQSTRIK